MALARASTALGVPNALPDPTLELRDGNGVRIVADNDWQDDSVQAIELTAAGLAPTNPLESAIAVTLSPGAYTALLGGRDHGTGVGVVEVYDRSAVESLALARATRDRGSAFSATCLAKSPKGRGRLAGGVSHRLGQNKCISPGRGAAHRSAPTPFAIFIGIGTQCARTKSVECRPSRANSLFHV